MARDDKCVCWFFLAVAAVLILTLLVLLFIQYKHPTPPLYYAAINSVSGVGADRELQPALFVLTLGVKSRSPLWRHPCIDRGTVVEVAHHGVALVAGAITCELCAPLWERPTMVLSMERSNLSGLPEFVMEGLAADARRGVQVFDVTMRIPSTGRRVGDDGTLVSCVARLAGDNSLADACDVHYS